jgi:hypothetical protein
MKRVHGVTKIVRVLTLIGLFSLLVNSPSKAALLSVQVPQQWGTNIDSSVTLNSAPDFDVGSPTVSYTASSGLFQVLQSYDNDGNSVNNYWDANGNENPNDSISADFTLTAYITSAGVLTNGTLSIAGDMTGDNFGPQPETTLLTGNLTTGAEGVAFGATSGTEAPFQFLFTVTGGSLSNDYGGIGSPNGYIYVFPDDGFTFNDTWTANFSTHSDQGYADVQMVVPEPSSFFLLMFGGALFGVAKQFQRSSRRRS